ncbi:CBS domain containing protein [Methanococcus aeolicus Nankai-3]|uniref:CBS domain containing protein n=1 Tax=Methanococcus aeolicus (strain ATCC BAA-1280 / DSM 17508 / OCM 812 / Nankai-3) TaxID=419665 RepID=A6UTZ0_META3|nr:CBS domain-containing protein [Methanococcus aeolicus]ABR55962.1 CBS domain containing protein [Methanococcus aeolicus Nankai-3]
MKVKDLMDTNILKIYPDFTAKKTVELMYKRKRFSTAVLDDEDRLIGWIMSLDLAILDDKTILIKDIMHPLDKIITLHENDPARDAVVKIVKHKVISIPVLNNERNVIGMVRNCDITKTLAKLYDIPLDSLFKTLQKEIKGITWEELMDASTIITKQTTNEEITAEEYEKKLKNTTFGQAIWACGGLEKFFAGLIKIGEVAIARKIARRK